MPTLRLRKHQANFSEEDILINPSDFNGLKLNDVVELKPPKGGDASNRILLQIRKWPETNSYPNSVSIKDSVVNTHLKLYADVVVNIVDKKDVLVDSIEICFSNAYLARSYMWGLRNHLNNRCVYQRQKLDYLHIRSQICEIWSQGIKVTSGYVDDDTKIVFRSASSLVYLFIQMSSEMWDYDINGDLYCEKAINGFLTDLFETWRRNDCSHDINIVLFSRTFYDAESIEEFPKEMRECLQVDYKNRFYEDCYRVAFQNDRFDLHDWNAKLTTLKSLFNQYQKEVIDRHQDKYDIKIPRAYNSSASQGNFLEVLNMSLNVFEKHYFDRSFDRTGQLSVVVSPGVGVFEVDLEMTNLTKQRIIDNGIGSDLVCLGEQPLHTVPLLKFNSKVSHHNVNSSTCDVYNMPHWINLSFYSSQNQVYYSSFIPRIKLPTIHNHLTYESSRSTSNDNPLIHKNVAQPNPTNQEQTQPQQQAQENQQIPPNTLKDHSNQTNITNNRSTTVSTTNFNNHNSTIPDLIDYDEYDAQVFKPNPLISYHGQQLPSRSERSVLSDLDSSIDYLTDNDDDFMNRDSRNRPAGRNSENKIPKRSQHLSENVPITTSRTPSQVQTTFTRLSLVDSYLTDVKVKPESVDDLSVRGYTVQSNRLKGSAARPKALINPFDPCHMTIKLTPNRRRWTHVFPQGPTGTFIQQHHYQPVPQQKSDLPYLADVTSSPLFEKESLPALSLKKNSAVSTQSPTSRETLKSSNDSRMQVQSSRGQVGTLDCDIYSRKMYGDNSGSSTVLNHSLLNASFNSSNGYNKSTLVSNDTVRFAWCASGEQEWTPAITTGVDWKSLTMPACLPLTTDFFPSKTSLQNDYVIGEYTIDSSCIHPRYTLIEVYRELVCQRLQKGFQIILLPRQTGTNFIDHHHPPSSVQKTSSNHQKSGQNNKSGTLKSFEVGDFDAERERTEYTMSIGRIFHKLSLNGNTITVTQYRPRHPYPTIKIDYCYRFRAPFHDNYGESWVHFKSEKLEYYSWNYLDNYICARGESFELRSSLKFWRFRTLILPSRPNLRKIPYDESKCVNNKVRHDIHYLTFNDDERAALMESFMKLLEIINKTRRASACRMSSSSYSSISSTSSLTMASTNTTSASANANAGVAQTPANKQQQHLISPTRLVVQLNNSELIQSTSDTGESNEKNELQFESINMDIDSALRDARRAEWIHVQYHSFYDIDSAFELVIKWMVASGACIAEMVQGWSRKAGNSSVHVVPIPWEPFALPHSGKADPLRCPIGIQLHIDCLLSECHSLDDNQVISLQEKILRRFGFMKFHDLISSEDIERQFVHISGFAFVALPNLINDDEDCADGANSSMDKSKHRHSLDNDVFLAGTTQNVCAVVANGSSNQQQAADQATISLASKSNTTTPTPMAKTSRSSSTTTMPHSNESSSRSSVDLTKSTPKKSKALISNLKLEHQETISSPHEGYITRHISGARKNKASRLRGENEQIEFIWSWNYMLTKRWRSPSTQDESYAVSLMQDFKDFCQNGDNRLVEFWLEIQNNL